MSIRPNSNKGRASLVPGIIFGIILAVVMINSINRRRHSAPSFSPPPLPAASVPVRNPLLEMLSEESGPLKTPREGIAIGVAIDVSGSMNNTVKDKDGAARPKIEIARGCALDILRQADAFARGHQDSVIEVGIFEFSSRPNQPSCRQVIPFGPVQAAPAADGACCLKRWKAASC